MMLYLVVGFHFHHFGQFVASSLVQARLLGWYQRFVLLEGRWLFHKCNHHPERLHQFLLFFHCLLCFDLAYRCFLCRPHILYLDRLQSLGRVVLPGQFVFWLVWPYHFASRCRLVFSSLLSLPLFRHLASHCQPFFLVYLWPYHFASRCRLVFSSLLSLPLFRHLASFHSILFQACLVVVLVVENFVRRYLSSGLPR